MSGTLNYFAYGSNLHPVRLESRIGACRIHAVAQLTGARLRFHKVGLDDSGKCDIELNSEPGSTVWGVIYQISPEQKEELDQYESLGRGYQILNTHVRLVDHQELSVFTYQAMAEFIDRGLKPFDWYHDYVTQGTHFHGFPAAYQQMIQAIGIIEDPDRERAAQHHAVLRELRKTIDENHAD